MQTFSTLSMRNFRGVLDVSQLACLSRTTPVFTFPAEGRDLRTWHDLLVRASCLKAVTTSACAPRVAWRITALETRIALSVPLIRLTIKLCHVSCHVEAGERRRRDVWLYILK